MTQLTCVPTLLTSLFLLLFLLCSMTSWDTQVMVTTSSWSKQTKSPRITNRDSKFLRYRFIISTYCYYCCLYIYYKWMCWTDLLIYNLNLEFNAQSFLQLLISHTTKVSTCEIHWMFYTGGDVWYISRFTSSFTFFSLLLLLFPPSLPLSNTWF